MAEESSFHLQEDAPARAGGADRRAHDQVDDHARRRRPLERLARALADARAGLVRNESLQAESRQLMDASRTAIMQSQALRVSLRASLRISVSDYARRLHDEQVPPERMVVLVKALVREGLPPHADVIERRELMDSAVRWSIEAYYAA
jgi:hypothetical protein